ncbi:MAG: TolC family protein [Gemmataceae bacterium]
MRFVFRRAAGAALLAAGCHTVAPPAAAPPSPPAAREVVSAVVPAAAVVAAEPAGNVLDLTVALQLAGVENPAINLAREQVREAQAEQLGASVLLLPHLSAGANVRIHRGALQPSPGSIRDTDLQSLYVGAGARAIGTGPPATPGVWLFAQLGDAVYARLAAVQRVTARSGDAAATQNGVLLDVATAYLELAGAEARLAVLKCGEEEVGEVARRTAEFARAGQGRKADADRVAANADLVRRDVYRAQEDLAVAAARLARLLNLDPALGLRTPGGEVALLELVPGDDLESLEALALAARPELVARSAMLLEARTRGRAERVRPWVPTVSVGFSSGAFGGGGPQTPSDFGQFGGRTDFDVLAAWNVQNLGLGNRARVRGADAATGAALAALDATRNQVRREVAEALAASRAAARQVSVARDALGAAEEGFRLDADRIRQGQGLPIETLDSFRQLLDARQELVRAVVAYDVAQFRLYAATGAGCGTGWAAPAR